MQVERMQQQIDFIMEIDKIKQIFRNTILLDASRAENDAEHSWHMAVGALILLEYAEKDVDMLRVLKLILIHDIAEIDAGDVFVYDQVGAVGKFERELEGAKRIFGLLPEDLEKEYFEYWMEFEEQKTMEAQYAKVLDTFMPLLHNYKTKGLQWQKHNITSDKVLKVCERIRPGSETLWLYMKNVIEDAVAKGYLKA